MLTKTFSTNQVTSEGRSGVCWQNRAEGPCMSQDDTIIQDNDKQHESVHRRIIALRWKQRNRERLGPEGCGQARPVNDHPTNLPFSRVPGQDSAVSMGWTHSR